MVFSQFVLAPFIAPNSKIPNSIQLIIFIASSILNAIFLKLKLILAYRGYVELAEEDDYDPVSFIPIRRSPTKYSNHDLYASDVVAELIRRVTTVCNFQDLIADPCKTYNEEDSCIVCLCQFQGKDEIRQLNTCRHIFHKSCLDRWIHHDQVLCPLCRTPFLPMEKKAQWLYHTYIGN
ncbi:hypothetical protein C5167_027845 [Papaver somniferum]|nr:hypothetical protein C5167_027845 [Papaver somniferum]